MNFLNEDLIYKLTEVLADVEHERWCKWQSYLHSVCIKNDDGSLTIPANYVEHWEYEIDTPYKNLPDKIKESDREEARTNIDTILRFYGLRR